MRTAGQAKKAFVAQLWDDNPVFRQVLGICSSLAVTNLMFNTLLMCLGLIWGTALTSATCSALRNYIPQRVRMIVQVLLASVYVIVVDIVFRARFFDVHQVIGPYVGLIITNCIIMGRAEAFAMKNPVLPSLLDGIGAGLGYSGVLMTVALIREVLGFGTVFGAPLPAREVWWHSWTIMVMPPGAFFVLALIVWAARAHALRRDAARKAKEAKK
ncbi:MAG: NADH:ubiquinone reductase (Na(+)-transporting) subunit D [Planctomycetes bacterium]|nr:NADH:ubiquinone reductase (Na(+)-transporting) subunit D [Planctomycetota bacterium]